MQTQLSAAVLSTAQGREADAILRRCVHCGFCNATCPTYQLQGDELDAERLLALVGKKEAEGKCKAIHNEIKAVNSSTSGY